jgi:hypothetical protein
MLRWLVVAGLLLAPRGADLDVAVAPGTPLEWTKELRPPSPTGYRGTVPTGGAKAVLEGNTTALGIDFGAANPLGVSRITTRDLPGHLPWTVPTESRGAGDRTPTPAGAITWEYPPRVTPLQWWWCMAVFLRAGMHPNLVSEAECANLLLEVGEPARTAADAVGTSVCPGVVKLIRAEVSHVPTKRPEAPSMDSPIQQVYARLAAEELTSDYPHGMNPYFAQRLLSLGEQAFPAVLACAKSEHAFLRRNAVAVLGGYSNPEGLALLREHAQSKDLVVRTRAVMALARRRDRAIVPTLVGWLDSRDDVQRSLAAHALGLIGHGDAGEPLLKKAKAMAGDGEFLFSALPALARIRMADEAFTRELRELVTAVGGRNYDRGNRADELRPDRPDPSGTRREILKSFGLLALAAQGDERAIDQAVKAASWPLAAQYLAIEVLGGVGEKGTAPLKAMVANPALEPVLRAQAYVRLALPVPETKYAKEVAGNESMPPGVRGIALSMLAGFDPVGTREIGRGVIEGCLKGRARDSAGAYLVMMAVQSLGRMGDLEVDTLLELLRLATERRRRVEAPKNPKQAQMPWWMGEVEIVIDVPLLESVVIELGRTRSKKAGEALASMVSDAPHARAEMAFALGAIGGKRALAALVGALEDRDGWVRWAAYTALHALTGREFFCDWIYGSAGAREEQVRKWKELLP